MNINIIEDVYEIIKMEVQKKCARYDVQILKESPSEKRFPMIIVTETNNVLSGATTNFRETRSALSIEIDIYATAKNVGTRCIQGRNIARDIRVVIDDIMTAFRCVRTFSSPTPNLDRSIYRYTLRYSANCDDYRGKII